MLSPELQATLQRAVEDVRRRDMERLKMQMQDGILAGRENLHTAPVPEPLVQPRKKGQALNEETRQALDGQ